MISAIVGANPIAAAGAYPGQEDPGKGRGWFRRQIVPEGGLDQLGQPRLDPNPCNPNDCYTGNRFAPAKS